MSGAEGPFALEGLCEVQESDAFLPVTWLEPLGFGHEDHIRQLALLAAAKGLPPIRTGLEERALWPLPPGEPEGHLREALFPDGRVVAILRPCDTQTELIGLFPRLPQGSQTGAVVKRVVLHESRLMAMLDLVVGGFLPLTCLDPEFAANRGFYAAGRHHDFLLTGLALHCGRPADDGLVVTPNLPLHTALLDLAPDCDTQPDGSIRLDLSRMAAILPRPDLAACAYEIRGTVTRRRQPLAGSYLGQPLTMLEVVCARDIQSDASVRIDLAVPARICPAAALPDVGDPVEAIVLMQAEFWMPDSGSGESRGKPSDPEAIHLPLTPLL